MRSLLMLCLFASGLVYAETQSNLARTQPIMIKYVPPMRGAPVSRVGGGSRGEGGDMVTLQALAPDHTGLTTKEQPILYWYVSKPTQAHFEVSVINDQLVDPLVDKDFVLPVRPGIQRLRLADFGVKLKPNVEYRWFVSLIVDPSQRSNDIIASGTIQRINTSPDLKARLANADRKSRPQIYAGSGIWYDALDALSELVDANPADATLREQRAALLEDVGLKEAAASDRLLEK